MFLSLSYRFSKKECYINSNLTFLEPHLNSSKTQMKVNENSFEMD